MPVPCVPAELVSDFAPLNAAIESTRGPRSARSGSNVGMLLSGAVTQGVIVALISITGSLAVTGNYNRSRRSAFISFALPFHITLSSITGLRCLPNRRRSSMRLTKFV